MVCFATRVFHGYPLGNFLLSTVSGPFAKVPTEPRLSRVPGWRSSDAWKLSFSKVCHFSRLSGCFWTRNLLRMRQLLYIYP